MNNDIQDTDTQHNNTLPYNKCQILFIGKLNVILLNVIMLDITILSVFS